MNKTFNDPNTRYSDQGTPLAQAADALNAIGDVTETVDELAETVDELSEKVDLIPVPVAADDGKVLTATDDGAYELADVDALPAISAGDAGKVLTVNAGETGAEWAASSGGVIIANYIPDEQTHTVSCDMTYDEIVSHLTNGELVVGNIMGSFIIPLYSPQEYTLIYVQNRYYVTTQQGDLTITMGHTQLSHVHRPNESELIDVTNDVVYWPVTRLQQ